MSQKKRTRHDENDSPQAEALPPYPQLDIERYLPQLDGFDMTEAQKNDHLRALWTIMTRFVDLAFDEPMAKDPPTPATKRTE